MVSLPDGLFDPLSVRQHGIVVHDDGAGADL
jgi:hypothetical protein